MKDPTSQAAIRRVSNGDHSPEAIAQLLLVLAICQTKTSDAVEGIKASVDTLAANQAACPARVGAAARQPLPGGILRLTLWCILGLIILLAAALGVSLPFADILR